MQCIQQSHSGRYPTLNNDILNGTIVSGSIKPHEFDMSCSTIHRHLKRIGKTCREWIWVLHELTHENWTQCFTICSILLIRDNYYFWNTLLQLMKNGCSITTEKKRQSLLCNERPVLTSKPDFHSQKSLLCILWNLKASFIMRYWNMEGRSMQMSFGNNLTV